MAPTPLSRHRPARMIRAATVLVALAAALTACGDAPPVPGQQGRTVQQILDDAGKAMNAAKSYHVSSDTFVGVTETVYDLDVVGKASSGTVSQDKNWTVHLVTIGDTVYLSGRSYWVDILGQAEGGQIGDRCVRFTPFNDKVRRAISAFTRYSNTAGYAQNVKTANGNPGIDGPTTFQGRAAISISDGASKEYIDAGKTSWPLHIEITFGEGKGFTNFSRFNQITQPPAAPIGCLDASQMSNSGNVDGSGLAPATTPPPDATPAPAGQVTLPPLTSG